MEHSFDLNYTDFHQVPDKADLFDFLQMDKTILPAFLQMAADLIPGITSFQLDFSMDSLLPLLLITSLNVLLVALLLGARTGAEVRMLMMEQYKQRRLGIEWICFNLDQFTRLSHQPE